MWFPPVQSPLKSLPSDAETKSILTPFVRAASGIFETFAGCMINVRIESCPESVEPFQKAPQSNPIEPNIAEAAQVSLIRSGQGASAGTCKHETWIRPKNQPRANFDRPLSKPRNPKRFPVKITVFTPAKVVSSENK